MYLLLLLFMAAEEDVPLVQLSALMAPVPSVMRSTGHVIQGSNLAAESLLSL